MIPQEQIKRKLPFFPSMFLAENNIFNLNIVNGKDLEQVAVAAKPVMEKSSFVSITLQAVSLHWSVQNAFFF